MELLSGILLGIGIGVAGYRLAPYLYRGNRKSLVDELKGFFAIDPYKLPIVSRTFAMVDLPNLHLAINQYAEAQNMRTRVIGYTSSFGEWQNSLREMIAGRGFWNRVSLGPVRYRQVDIDVGRPPTPRTLWARASPDFECP